MKTTAFHLLWFLVSWIVGFSLTLLVFSDAPAGHAYSLIVGWWLACFVAAKIRVALRTFLPAWVIYFTVFIIVWLMNNNFLYHDTTALPVTAAILVGGMQAVVFSSPILVNYVADLGLQLLTAKQR